LKQSNTRQWSSNCATAEGGLSRLSAAEQKGKSKGIAKKKAPAKKKVEAKVNAPAAGANLSKAIPRVIHRQSPCACLALFIVHVYTNTTCNTIDVNKARRRQSPLCARVFSLLAHAMPLPARALLRVCCACACLPRLFSVHTVDVGILLQRHSTGESIQRSAGRAASGGALASELPRATRRNFPLFFIKPTRTPGRVGDSCDVILRVIRPQTLRLSMSCFCLHVPCPVLPERASFFPNPTT